MSRFASNLHRPVWWELPTATGGRASDTSCHTRQFCGCRALLAVAGIVALAVPLAFSLMHPIQAPLADAQSDGKGEAQFDVASIRLNKSHDAGVQFGFTDDGFDATNISVILLLKPAYGVEEDQKRKRMIRPL